jgi:hypothetical protein
MPGIEVENCKNEDQFMISGKELKELYWLARGAIAGNTRQDYHRGTKLLNISISVNRLPDFAKILEEVKKLNEKSI